MLSFYCDNDGVKKFMNYVFKTNIFDKMQIRSGEIVTRGHFSFEGIFNHEYDGIKDDRKYCLWGEVRTNFFDLIKGKKMPKTIKLVFALDNADLEKLHPNAQAAFLNAMFENGQLCFTTGTAQKNFSMDKSLDLQWEESVKLMFKRLEIAVVLQ